MILETNREREIAKSLLNEDEFEFFEMMFNYDDDQDDEWIDEDDEWIDEEDQEMFDDLYDRGFVEPGENDYPKLTLLGELGIAAYRATRP